MDADHLLRLAREKSTAGRSELAATVSDLFSGKDGTLTERERTLMYDILHQVVRDAEMEIRKIIATRLAEQSDAPVELVELLANDDIEVAFPILSESAVLEDAHLIEIIRNRTLEHQMAVAIRDSVSEEVSEVLVQTGDERVIKTLLENPDANVSQATMEFLVEESQRVDAFHEPILRRKELEPAMAKRMYLWVSAALRKYVVDHCGLSQSEIDDLIEGAVVDRIHDPEQASGGISKSKDLATKLHEDGAVTPELMIKALKDGEVRLFVDMMGQVTGVRDDLIMRFILEPGGEGLSVAGRAIGLTDDEFRTIFTLCRKARPIKQAELRRRTSDAMDLFGQIDRGNALEVVKRWRRDVGYLAALRALDLS